MPKNVVTNVKHWLPTEGHSQHIRTRCFYNSAFDNRKLQGLLARGNKYRYLSQGVHKSAFVQYSGKKGFPVLDRKVNNVCTNYDNVDMRSQISLDDKNIAPMGQGSKNQVTPVLNAGVNTCDTQGGDVNHHSPCEAKLHIANVKQCNPNTGHGLAINRCEKVDNGQSVFDSIVLEEVLTEGKDTIDSQRCENVIDKGGNSVDMSNKTVPLFDIKWSSDDKFVNTLFTRTLKIPSENVEVQQLLEKWQQQTDFTFGFVPVSQFIIPDVHAKGGDTIECPIKMHTSIRDSGAPNFLKCRIPVQSQLNIGVWKKVLANYWDAQLIHLLEYGFPLDFNRKSPLLSEHKNHSSAIEFPDHVDAYLDVERRFNAILGPFRENPIPGAHSSPFMTREKSDSEKRRVIVDLSWPKHASVNAGVDKDSYLGTDFILTFPTVDDIIQEVKSLGKGCHLYKVDISRAFRHVKIDPRDYDLLGLEWRNASYFDTCLPFGNRHGTQIFQRISDAVRYVMRQKGFRVLNYMDDFVGVATSDVVLLTPYVVYLLN